MQEHEPRSVTPEQRVRLLAATDVLHQEMQGSHLSQETFAANLAHAEALAEFLGCTPWQAMLFAVLTGLSLQDETADWSHLATYFDCTPIQALALRQDLEAMVAQEILVTNKPSNRIQGVDVYESQTYSIRRSWYDILTGVEPAALQPSLTESGPRLLHLLDILAGILHERFYEELPIRHLWQLLKPHLDQFGPELLPALKAEPVLDEVETVVLLLLAYRLSNSEDMIDLNELCNLLYPDMIDRSALRLRFMREQSALQAHKWILLRPNSQDSGFHIRLTEKGLREAFDPQGSADLSAMQRELPLIEPSKIKTRDLLYNKREAADIETLDRLLAPTEHQRLMKQFAELGLGSGLTVLLHGRPGTGKTETVYQLCRRHGRRLQRVDISAVRSMWYGESEKNLRMVFDQYRRWLDEFEETPVMMFNEADALFGQRLQTQSSADQTHNTLQNILLDEMERFEGILFVTTNLVRQIDLAFDRRFLFKIRLDPPEEDIRNSIWHQRLTQLSEAQAAELARRFTLSGGQIDNIVRRYRLLATLRDKPVRFEELLSLCRNEGLSPQAGSLGFQPEPPIDLLQTEVS